VVNGQEVNGDPQQSPGRSIINFSDWPIERSRQYIHPYQIVEEKVKPDREKQNDDRAKKLWWLFKRPTIEIYTRISPLKRCFVAVWVSKYLNFSAQPTNIVFTNSLYVFTTDRFDLYAVVQSNLHEVWARKYSGALKQDLRYSPSDCFITFPFPEGVLQSVNSILENIGERYHEYRRTLMLQLWLGLTDIYNLFHTRDLTPERVAKVSKKAPEEAQTGYQGLLELRRLHVELDTAIRDAYDWQDLDLGHDFHEVETLPENDRVRYTISPAARKEVLKRLLAENHRRAAEQTASTPEKAKTKRGKMAKTNEDQSDIFQ
jgi:hypothetical protein